MELISVIIPTYNHDFKLKRAIDSVLSQTYQNFEIIIVDNHSTDQTDAVIDAIEDERVRYYKVHNNGIIAVSRNVGILNAKGVYLALLDSDDWWEPEKLEKSIFMLQYGYDIVYHDLWLVTRDNQGKYKKTVGSRTLQSPIYKDLLSLGNALPNSSVVFKKKLIDEVGLISEDIDLKGVEDFDFWLRISKTTENFGMIPSVLGYYWYGGGNFSQNAKKLLNGINKLIELHAEYLRKRLGVEPTYLLFRRGRTAFLSGDVKIARSYLKELKSHRLTFLQRLKVNWMLLSLTLTASKYER